MPAGHPHPIPGGPLAVSRKTPNQRVVLALLAVAQLMAGLDAIVVDIALRSAHRALHFTDENYQWIMTAYETGLVQPAES
jgi:hypothetical protein